MADHPPVPPSPAIPRPSHLPLNPNPGLVADRMAEWAQRACIPNLKQILTPAPVSAPTPAPAPTPTPYAPNPPVAPLNPAPTLGPAPTVVLPRGVAPVPLENVLKAWLSPAQYRGYLLGKSLEQLHGACGERPTVRTATVRDTMMQLSLFDEELL